MPLLWNLFSGSIIPQPTYLIPPLMHGGVCSKVARGICPWNVEPFFFFFSFSQRRQAERVCLLACCPRKKKRKKKGRLKRSRLIGLVISSQDCFMKPVCSQMSCLFFFSFDCMAAFAPPTAPLLRTLLARFSLILPPPTPAHTGRTAVFPTNNWLLEKKKSQLKVGSHATIFLTAALRVKPYIWDLFRIIDCISVN